MSVEESWGRGSYSWARMGHRPVAPAVSSNNIVRLLADQTHSQVPNPQGRYFCDAQRMGQSRRNVDGPVRAVLAQVHRRRRPPAAFSDWPLVTSYSAKSGLVRRCPCAIAKIATGFEGRAAASINSVRLVVRLVVKGRAKVPR